ATNQIVALNLPTVLENFGTALLQAGNKQIAVRVDLNRLVVGELDLVRVGAGLQNKIVLDVVAARVIQQVDAGVDVFVADAAIMRDAGVPVLLVSADEIAADTASRLFEFHRGAFVCAEHIHADIADSHLVV